MRARTEKKGGGDLRDKDRRGGKGGGGDFRTPEKGRWFERQGQKKGRGVELQLYI